MNIDQFNRAIYLHGSHDHIILDAALNYPDFNCYNIAKYLRIEWHLKSSSLFMDTILR